MTKEIGTNDDYDYASDELGRQAEDADDNFNDKIDSIEEYESDYVEDSKTRKNDSKKSPGRKAKTQAEIDRDIVEEFYNKPTSSNFSNIWKRFYYGVHSYAARIIGDWEKSDDIVSETFMRAWNYRDMFDRAKTYSTWLYTICRNLCMTAVKTDRNYCLDIDLNDIVDSIYRGDNPHDEKNSTPDNYYTVDDDGNILTNSYEVVTKRIYDASLAEISTMSPMFRKIVDMKINQGMTFKQIGQTLNIKEHDAKNIYYQNKRLLSEIMMDKHSNLYRMYLDVNQEKDLNELEYNSYVDSINDENDLIYIFD